MLIFWRYTMKNRITITKFDGEIKFYLKNSNGEFWLFSQPYSKGVYEWFKNCRSEKEIIEFNKWEQNKRLNNTIDRIPRKVKYATKYIISYESEMAM